jgi:hypothetical protein
MRFPWLKEKCVARSHFGYPMLVAHLPPARNHQVKLRLSRVRVIGTKEFAFGNSDECQIEWMSLRQMERLRFAPKRDRNVLGNPAKLSFRRFFFLLGNVFEIDLSHLEETLGFGLN